MDVRCERCRAQYVFDDDQVTPAGLTVQCTNCGHVFKVKKKELVVTVAVKPDEIESAPMPATAAAPRTAPEPREPVREWQLRQVSGSTFTFRELTTLQKWIIERKVGRDDELSHGGEPWKRLGDIGELAGFFQVVEAAERARAQPPAPAAPQAMPPIPSLPLPAYGPGPGPGPGGLPPPPSGYPPPSYTMPLGAARPAQDWRPEPLPGPPGPPDQELEPEEVAAVKKGRGGRLALVVVLLAAAAGATVYVFAPQLLGGTRAPELLAPPPVEPKPAPAAEPPAPQPRPAPGAAAAAPAPAAAEPAPGRPSDAPGPVPAKPPAATGPRALLAQAEKLREKGDLEAALDLYGRVAADDPENVEALTGRGLCYLDLEKYPPAEASFQAALKVDPRQQDALLGLAETYRWQGKKADAIRYYERFLATDPQGEDAEVARNALEELRK